MYNYLFLIFCCSYFLIQSPAPAGLIVVDRGNTDLNPAFDRKLAITGSAVNVLEWGQSRPGMTLEMDASSTSSFFLALPGVIPLAGSTPLDDLSPELPRSLTLAEPFSGRGTGRRDPTARARSTISDATNVPESIHQIEWNQLSSDRFNSSRSLSASEDYSIDNSAPLFGDDSRIRSDDRTGISFDPNMVLITMSAALKNGVESIDANPFVDPISPRPAAIYPEPSALLMAGASVLIGLVCWFYRRLDQVPAE